MCSALFLVHFTLKEAKVSQTCLEAFHSFLKPDLFAVQMSKMKSDLLDTKEISSDTLPGLFMDLLAGESSLHRKVFGG